MVVFVCAALKSRLFFYWRCFYISNVKHQINEAIKDREVRLISEDGTQMGIVKIQDAQRIALDRNLDLVKIAPQAVPPVCRIMDYGKYRFEQAKREKEARKNQHIVEIKELQLSIGIGIHDLNVRLNQAAKFLQNGDKIKASIRFRGREMAHTQLGQELLLDFAERCSEYGTIERPPKLEGRHMLMFLTPRVNKQ